MGGRNSYCTLYLIQTQARVDQHTVNHDSLKLFLVQTQNKRRTVPYSTSTHFTVLHRYYNTCCLRLRDVKEDVAHTWNY